MADDPLAVLAERLQLILLRDGRTLATAESCTGGLVAHAITEIGGSSGYYRGGFVTYANDVKRDQLGVAEELLTAHGAVSAQVARAMAEGVRARLGADLGIAVTGVAGPGGGTAEKPVGLTYVAVADANGVDVRRHHWTGNRSSNKRESAAAVLELVLERVAGAPAETTTADTSDDPGAA